MSTSHKSGAGGSKDCYFQNTEMYKNDETLPKIRIISKKLQVKVVQDSISYKKVNGRVYLSPTGVELRAPKIAIFETL